jgi:hypothetical protein
MFLMYPNFFIKITIFCSLLLFLNSCGIYRPTDAREFPPEPEKRVQKNISEGRGIKIFQGGNKGGDFDFATSNEMWRASLDTINFMPLLSVDYGGGLIITDWFSDSSDENESIKITIRFLSNEIRVDALDVKVFTKKCSLANNCAIIEGNSNIEEKLKMTILKKASTMKKASSSKIKKRPLSTINPDN